MTETSILPGAAPSTESGIDMVPPGTGVEESEGGDRRRLLILGGIVGLLVVLAAGYMLLHKGSASNDATFVPHSIHPAPAAPAGGKKAAPSANFPRGSSGTNSKGNKGAGAPAKLPRKAKAPQVRDPFKPLVIAPVGGSSTDGTTTTTVNSSTGSTTPTTTPTAPVDTQSTAPTVQQSTPPPTTTGKGHVSGTPQWIQLMRVSGDRATFRVGYAQHKFRTYNVQAPKPTASRGTVFDKIFSLIGIQNGKVTLQTGDDTPFDLSKGIAHSV